MIVNQRKLRPLTQACRRIAPATSCDKCGPSIGFCGTPESKFELSFATLVY